MHYAPWFRRIVGHVIDVAVPAPFFIIAAYGVRLVGAHTGEPVGFVKALFREIAHLLDSISLNQGYLLPLWTSKRHTIADTVARTVVLR